MKKVKLLKPVAMNGRVYHAGEEIEVPEEMASRFETMGVIEKPSKAKATKGKGKRSGAGG